jgi:predicted transcriptional regulator
MARRLDRGQNKIARARFAFESMDGLLKVLTANRWALLRALRRLGPASRSPEISGATIAAFTPTS